VRELWERVRSLQLQMNDQAQASAQALGRTEENLGRQVARVDRQVVNVAVGGLAIQAWGLILVTVGTMLAAVPALAQISSPTSPSAAHSAVHARAHHGPRADRSVG
jgi:pyridoxal biosynthesis lyase PdxS